jgi:hypothetical protein
LITGQFSSGQAFRQRQPVRQHPGEGFRAHSHEIPADRERCRDRPE